MRIAMRFVSTLIAASAALSCGATLAQEYPSKPVRILAPFAAGASGDIITRTAAEYFEKQTRQAFVTENRPGAGGIVGSNEAKRAAPDGYTLLLGIDAFTQFPLFQKDATFDLQKDMAPISMLARVPLVLIGNTSSPAKSFNEMVAYAKANPGKLNYGAVPASPGHLFAFLLMNKAAIDLTIVPYQAAVAMTQSIVSNETQVYVSIYGSNAGHVKAGKLVVLAVIGPQRQKWDPSVPTLSELKIPINMSVWWALFAPNGTPQPIIQRLAALSAELVKQPFALERFEKLALEPVGSTPAELAKQVAEDTRERAEAARIGKIQPQ
jgi:tripartite-type tricarboxylate transporter receptor subunit TctC